MGLHLLAFLYWNFCFVRDLLNEVDVPTLAVVFAERITDELLFSQKKQNDQNESKKNK